VSLFVLTKYTCPFSMSDIVICQTVIRCMFATKRVKQLQHMRRVGASTIIQIRWRGFVQRQYFTRTTSAVIRLQACVRMAQAVSAFNRQKTYVTNIATAWRCHKCVLLYKQAVRGMYCAVLGPCVIACAYSQLFRIHCVSLSL
jgi:hypothetical protein